MKKLLFILLFIPQLANSQPITDGLIGYWPFNGNANDESVNSYNGQVVGATLATGKANDYESAYFLSAQKYIDLGDHDEFDFGAREFSVATWINKTSANTSWKTAFIGKWNNGGKVGTNEWLLTSGGNANDIPNFTIEIGNTRYSVFNDTELALNTWYHLVAVRKATSIELYINGELKSSLEVPAGAINNVGRNLLFGKFGGEAGAAVYYNQGAKIDEVMIFNRALGTQEIATIYGGPSEGGIPDAVEHQALVDLFNSTNGGSWTNNTNWLQGNTIADLASWYGVTVTNGDVTGLSLAVNDLDGELPASIGNLKKLEYLNLSGNQLRGSIPPSLGDITNLLKLFLHNNNLTGEIPASIGNLSYLTHLYLYLNDLSGVIPTTIGNLTKLEILYLYDNMLTGPIPSSIGGMESLRYLSLYNNALTGSIPESIGALTSLLSININSNALTGSIPSSISKLGALKTLSLNYNALDGIIPTNIGDLSQLEILYLRGNSIGGHIPESIGKLAKLRNLMIDRNDLTGSIPESIGNCVNLVYIYLQSNKLTGSIPESMGNLKKAYHFYANSNQLTGRIPDAIGGMTNLVTLYLLSNNFTGVLPPSLGTLSRLQRLEVANNQLEGDIPESIKMLENLKRLVVHNNQFTSFPDFSAHSNRQQMTITIYTNRIKFESLEGNFTSPGTHVFSSFSYHTQSPLPAKTISITTGQSATLDTEDHAPHNHFQWQKLINGEWSNIEGATLGTYSIPSISFADASSYRCRITNDWVTSLTIYSKTLNVEVKAPLVPEPPANLVKNRPTDETRP